MTEQMTTTARTPPSTDELARRAAKLSPVIERIAQDPALPEGVAPQRNLEEALKFLDVAAHTSEPVAPSAVVDIAWHHFILFTRDYMDYCATHLGRFVHHVPDEPGTETETDHDSYLRTRQLIAERFGNLDPAIWPDADALADCQSQGNCTADCTGDCKGS